MDRSLLIGGGEEDWRPEIAWRDTASLWKPLEDYGTSVSWPQNERGTPKAAASIRTSTRGIHESIEMDLDSRHEESENTDTKPFLDERRFDFE